MMYGWNAGMGGWGWLVAVLGVLVFVAVAVAATAFLLRAVRPGPGRQDPEQTLAGRFARGEIDEAEYRRRLEVLEERAGVGR